MTTFAPATLPGASYAGVPVAAIPVSSGGGAPELRRCEDCGTEFEPNRIGRPRRFCDGCSGSPYARRWRAENPERVEAYKAAQRVAHDPRPCVECGEDFTPNRVDRIVCSTSCRWKRKRRLKREREAAA